MFSIALQEINDDIAFSSLETCTEIGTYQIIKLTSDKNQVNRLVSYGHTKLPEDFTILVDDTALIVKDQVTLLSVTLDSRLDFNAHIDTVCKETCRKLYTLIRIAKYLNKNQKKMLINAFFCSHFNHCPIIWMFSSKAANNQVEKLHKRALQIIKSDSTATYENLLPINESITIHKRNLQFLMTERTC